MLMETCKGMSLAKKFRVINKQQRRVSSFMIYVWLSQDLIQLPGAPVELQLSAAGQKYLHKSCFSGVQVPQHAFRVVSSQIWKQTVASEAPHSIITQNERYRKKSLLLAASEDSSDKDEGQRKFKRSKSTVSYLSIHRKWWLSVMGCS